MLESDQQIVQFGNQQSAGATANAVHPFRGVEDNRTLLPF